MFKWSDKYSVGNTLIDSQHKKLVALINELHSAMKEGRGKDSLHKILDDIVDYTVEHFNTEEALMRKANYAGLTAHKAEHEKLKETAVALQKSLKAGETTMTLDVMNFLRNWLVNHIEGTDKKYKGIIG